MKIQMPRHTPVVLVAAGCLLLGSTGGAVAGAMVTGKQIKDNTVTTKDIKNGSLAVKDMSKAARKKLASTPGPAGATGPAGPRGVSAWDTLPSGVTVTGRFYDVGRAATPLSSVVENINYPVKAPAAPTALGFGEDAYPATVTDPACTGTYAAPTAPAGRVCVYLDSAEGMSSAVVDTWDEPAHRPYAFYLQFVPTTAGETYDYWGSWAYTAS